LFQGKSMSLFDQVLLLFLGSILTAFITSLLYVRQAKADLKKEYESRFNEKKWEVYSGIIELFMLQFEYFLHKDDYYDGKLDSDGAVQFKQLIDKYSVLRKKVEGGILLVGSKEVVESFLCWELVTMNNSPRTAKATESLIKLINNIRKDLGNEYSKLNHDDLNGIFYFDDKTIHKMFELTKNE
jgi:hypothetical protein